MLSKEMYELLIRIPRFPESIHAGKIYEGNPTCNRIRDLLCEAAHTDYDYISYSGNQILDSKISLTEKGQAAVEEYKEFLRNKEIVETSLSVSQESLKAAQESLKVAQESLKVAEAAKIAAIASAIAAGLALIPQIVKLVEWIW